MNSKIDEVSAGNAKLEQIVRRPRLSKSFRSQIKAVLESLTKERF